VAGAAVGAILIIVVLVREREGERILPWTSGEAHPQSKALAPTLFGLFGDLKRVLILRQSVIITSAVLTVRLAAGMFIACAPVFAVQKLGHSAASYSESYGLLSGAAALVGLAAGPLVDRLGAKKVMLIALCCGAVLQLSFGLMESAWSATWFVLVMLGVYLLVEQVIFIGMIAQYMNLTWEKVAATQFAVYMALTNLGRSAGSAVFASTVAFVDFKTLFLGMGSLMLVSAFLLTFFNQQRHLDNLTQLSRPRPGPSQP
jgi:PAT family beta-lactamase induction signal transducer AmpG